MKRLLVINSDGRDGVSKYRFTDPYKILGVMYPNEYNVRIIPALFHNISQKEIDFDVLVLAANMLVTDELVKELKVLQSKGVEVIADIDDYWEISDRNPAYHTQAGKRIREVLPQRLHIPDKITTTTTYLASKLARYNKNVFVIPNGLDENEKQFIQNKEESDKTRFGWVGGSSHLYDLQILKGVTQQFKNDNVQFVMCGFETLTKNFDTNQLSETDKPRLWLAMESIFTDDYKLLPSAYKDYLLRCVKEPYFDEKNMIYRRVWSKPIYNYGKGYNLFDVAIAPLETNEFNRCKSQLKVIEAGFHKMPVIATELEPYSIDIEDGKDGFLIPRKREHGDFAKKIKFFKQNPNAIEDMGLSLYEKTRKYTLQNLSKLRHEMLSY